MADKGEEGKKAFDKICNEVGLSVNEILTSVNKSDDLFNAIEAIHDVGLFHLINADTGIYDKVKGNETQDELYKLIGGAIDAVLQGEIRPKKMEILLRYSKSDSPIIILGESGTGKELLATAIHQISNRKNGPFTPINATALTETLFESEMFGYAKGAFTGALSDKIGQLQMSHKGTFFLDELGKMPKSHQAKLLRVMEDKKIRKVGSPKEEIIDIRFIVALQEEEIDKGQVLPDLLYRLKYPDALRMPSLNEELIKYGWKIIESAKNKVMKELIPEQTKLSMDKYLLDYLIARPYKGNYRELENILHHAIMHRDPYQMDNLSMSCIEELPDRHSCATVSDKTYPTVKLSEVLSDTNELEKLFIERPAVSIILDYENIKLTDIISHTEKVESLIIKGMVIHRDIGNFKKTISTGDPNISYSGFVNKLTLKLGMTPTAFAKKYKKSMPPDHSK